MPPIRNSLSSIQKGEKRRTQIRISELLNPESESFTVNGTSPSNAGTNNDTKFIQKFGSNVRQDPHTRLSTSEQGSSSRDRGASRSEGTIGNLRATKTPQTSGSSSESILNAKEPCKVCLKPISIRNIGKHTEIHDRRCNYEWIHCRWCGMAFRTKEEYGNHVRVKHILCPYCLRHYEFNGGLSLDYHIKTCSKKK